SFGPHPSLFFVPADDEILYLLDAKNDFKFVAREISTDTNFSGSEIFNETQLKDFAKNVSFPSHGLIMRKEKGSRDAVIKGIDTWESLYLHFQHYKMESNSVFVETEMRAMYNPMRMRVIGKATHKLVRIIHSVCPACGIPGFWITDAIRGLPCARCGRPTRSVLSHIYQCQNCQYRREEIYPDQKIKEDPLYCDFCNP
ncbi:MAG: hypothetical protein KGM98_04105, partial [Bacteroidota bacterium]|nr:hypothetical protein [Bacteroidota bacterium]